EPIDRIRQPDDELALAGRLVDHRRAVAQLGAAQRQRLPQLLAAVLVEGDHDAVLAADQADQPVAIEQRVGGVAPQRHTSAVILGEVLRPQHLAAGSVETGQVAHRSQRVDLAAGDHGRHARTDRIGDRVSTGILVLPELLAVGRVETEDALAACQAILRELVVRVSDAPGKLAVHQVDLAAGYSRPGVTATDGGAPEDLRPTPGELREDPLLAPDAVALRPKPLRPVVAPRRRDKGRQPQPDGPGDSLAVICTLHDALSL